MQLPQSAGEEKSEKQEKDEMIMSVLLDQVLPRATSLYLAGPLQVSSSSKTGGPLGGHLPYQLLCQL
jgi:hypothetical protein